ncbi:MAG: hypothetical protein ACRDDM_08510, partial [Paraclostridium sp.]
MSKNGMGNISFNIQRQKTSSIIYSCLRWFEIKNISEEEVTFMRKVLYIRIMKITLVVAAIILIFNLAKYIYKEHFAEVYISPEKGIAKIKELENED